MSKEISWNDNVVDAYLLLVKMIENAKKGEGLYRTERIEQAMEYLLNDIERKDEEPHVFVEPRILVRDVMGNAGLKLRNRINLLKKYFESIYDDSIYTSPLVCRDEFEHKCIEFREEIQSSDLSKSDKSILLSLLEHGDIKLLASEFCVSLPTMRTRVHRARKKFISKRNDGL